MLTGIENTYPLSIRIMSYNLIAISGSLREKSINTQLAHVLKELAPAGTTIDVVSIADVPLYNQDQDAAFPAGAQAFKDRVRGADGIIIVTPEYNRSIPGVLKNAIDWASRPYGDNAFAGKPVYVLGASSSPVGTALAQYDVKKVMLYLDAHVLGQPESFITGVPATNLYENGTITDEATRANLQKALTTFVAHIENVG